VVTIGSLQRVFSGGTGRNLLPRVPTVTVSLSSTSRAWGRRFFSLQVSALCCSLDLSLYCLVVATTTLTEAAKVRKGKNFSPEEERQLCRSCLHISQDPISGNGQHSTAFWERILKHYNDHLPTSFEPRPSRLLETKWGVIKHDVAKFCGVYKYVVALNESITSAEDVLERALELYKVKHPKQLSFNFLYCWLLLKDVPRWWDSPTEVQHGNTRKEKAPVAMPKRKMVEVPTSTASEEAYSGEEDDVEILSKVSFAKRPTRPVGNKHAKEDHRQMKQRDMAVKAQARATAEMAAANMHKAQILHDQATLSLFTMSNEESLSDLAREYINLRREEEMEKLRCRIAEEKAAKARAAVEAKTLADIRAVEVALATRNRIPPLPQGPSVTFQPLCIVHHHPCQLPHHCHQKASLQASNFFEKRIFLYA
jgi:hypothetical protein